MSEVGGLPSNSPPASDYVTELHDAVQDRWSNKITADAFFRHMQDALQHLNPSELNKALSKTDLDHLVSDIGSHGRSDTDQLTDEQTTYLLGQLAKAGPDHLADLRRRYLDRISKEIKAVQVRIKQQLQPLTSDPNSWLGRDVNEMVASIDRGIADFDAHRWNAVADGRQI